MAKLVPRTLFTVEEVAGLRSEFDRLSSLRHPNLVRVIELGEDERWVWLISERVAGVPLDEPSLHPDERTLIAWAEVLLDVLAYVHDRGVIHHDLKPDNVLISPDGAPESLRLIDLGLATQRYFQKGGELRGTRGYLAPELFSAHAVDPRADLYSAGILFGKLSRGGGSPEFSRWLDRMTRENPEERFSSAWVARSALSPRHPPEAVLRPFLLESLPRIGARSFDLAALKALVRAIHPRIHLEETLLSELHGKTDGDGGLVRPLLGRILKRHPTVEEFRQHLVVELASLSPAPHLGRRDLFRLLRRRRFERALVALERVRGGEAVPLRVRLLLEAGRLNSAKTLLEALPASRTKGRLEDRLAFLEGRYSDCRPTPEVLLRLGRFREAYLQAERFLLGRGGSRRRRAETERIAGLAAFYDGDTQRALAHLASSRGLWRQLGDLEGYVPTLNQHGMALAQSGRFKEAARCHRHAAFLAARTGDRRRSIAYLLNLASVELELGNVARAVNHFESGITASRQLGTLPEGITMTQNLANVWLQAGNPDRAQKLLEQAQAWLKQTDAAPLKLYQRILRADLQLARNDREGFLAGAASLLARTRDAGRYAAALGVLAAQAQFLAGNLDESLARLGRSGTSPLHRALLECEWSWEKRRIPPEEIERRYRESLPKTPKPRENSFFRQLRRMRFLGLISRACASTGKEFPPDLRQEADRLRESLERHSSPEIWGAIYLQLGRWFEAEATASSKSLSQFGEEARTAMKMLLNLVRRMTGRESKDTLLRTLLEEMMRLAEVSRGGIVLRIGDRFAPYLFAGRPWEQETDLPADLSRSLTRRAVRTRRPVLIPDARNLDGGAASESIRKHDLRGVIVLPLLADGKAVGAVYLDDPERPLRIGEAQLELLQGVADHAAVSLQTALLLQDLRLEEARVKQLNEKLERFNIRLQQKISHLEEMRVPYGTGPWEEFGIVGTSAGIRQAVKAAGKVAKSSSPVLISGEAGTELEALARAIAATGDRAAEPYLVLDCAAVPEQLFEAELFGYEPGAFTGAEHPHRGVLRAAENGTVLLHSVSSLSPNLQAKLLRVLQERRVRPLGSAAEFPVSARFLATVEGDPKRKIAEGKLREDLYYRLAVVEIPLPPLRDRLEDVPYLVRQLLRDAGRRENRAARRITKGVLERFTSHLWPGNLRELSNELERASLSCEGDPIDVEDLSEHLRSTPVDRRGLPTRRMRSFPGLRGQIERRVILHAIREAKGNYRAAAKRLRISLVTLYRKAKKHGIR